METNLKSITIRNLRLLGLLYGIIIALINYLGLLIVKTQSLPILHNESYEFWVKYINEHPILVNTLSLSSFVIPTVMCLGYILVCKEDQVAGRIINIPLAFAIIGSQGWFISLLLECIVAIYIRIHFGMNMHTVAMSSFLNILECCIFITTLSFMLLYTLHRLFFLPKFFPDGKLRNYSGSKKISTTAIITIFYLSTGLFPIFYIVSSFRNYSLTLGFEIEHSIYYMITGIVVLSVVILMTVSSYFTPPLRKLNKATEHIKNAAYDEKINIISNDDLGVLADNFNDMSYSLSEKTNRIAEIQESIIRGMAIMVESRDNSTGGHINRTSECVRVFVKKMQENPEFNITDTFAKAVIKAAPMHDLGKIAIDDAILRKPGRFTPEEFEEMKKHSAEGARIVAEVLKASDDEYFKKIAINVAHFHHEKWDGNGYPNSLSGENIPYEARIMALADVFDALVSKRCYKESMDYDRAFNIIEESLGSHFDPILGKFFISCRDDLEALYNVLPE